MCFPAAMYDRISKNFSTHSWPGAADSGPGVVGAELMPGYVERIERKFMGAKMKADALGFLMSPKSNRESE